MISGRNTLPGALARTTAPLRTLNDESAVESEPFPSEGSPMSMRIRAGPLSVSYHVAVSTVPAARVTIVRCVNVSVRYHLPS